ncbi:MAG TPA: hypothetical protein VFQ79_05750 [Bryobacteraceae bacterium]|nr:hypothetical protein [Bryobacteraceae bacterium]
MSVLNILPFVLIAVVFLVLRSTKDKMEAGTRLKLLYFSFGYIAHAIVAPFPAWAGKGSS